MNEDIKFLKETLKLAKKGLGRTSPNPMVGAVIVRNGRIIGQGFHRQAGLAHAEIEALNSATENPQGATLYINLEPCTIFGRTPPCTEAIIKSGIKKIVCCTLDPNPKVHGQGLIKLKEAGIETAVGILEDEARVLNEAFFTFHEKRRPFIAIKFATSLDGKMATRSGDSKWITNRKAREYARNLRGQYQAILVGIHTILADNPNLGVRTKGQKDPFRIIIDPRLQISLDADVLRDTNVLIVTTSQADNFKKELLKNKVFTVLVFDSKQINIGELLSKLREKEIISILVEGGGETLGNFIDSRLVDKVYAFHAPIIIGGKNAFSIGGNGANTIKKAIKLKKISFQKFDDNSLTIGYIHH
ncbi:MAG: bifunctional diaminohydroxyphosphoribosylaminopyrimidine deaminase/5-amino-6-(5-phosphoribosylamino)uracil reductase RibD [Patescibacteria group bacterium]|nr:bifunctional diaminohydroxyphosphoribosylaminopyrimidine deaminase/5-amino-6-(5-phosphoribosylamino)uracil reductase RibD [Patescibacteria group bacterium]